MVWYHANKALFKQYNYAQKLEVMRIRHDSCHMNHMKMSHLHDSDPFERNNMARIASFSHDIKTFERLNDLEYVLNMS